MPGSVSQHHHFDRYRPVTGTPGRQTSRHICNITGNRLVRPHELIQDLSRLCSSNVSGRSLFDDAVRAASPFARMQNFAQV
jgi:hypothetical protein